MLILSLCKLWIDLMLYYMVCCLFLTGEVGFGAILLSLFGCGMGMLLCKSLGAGKKERGYSWKKAIGYASLTLGFLPWLLQNVRGASLWGMLGLLIPVIYTVYLSIRPGTEEYLEAVEKHFLIYLAAGLGIVLFGKLLGNSSEGLVLFFLYAILCIFTMQVRRMVRNGNCSWKQIGMITLVMGILAAGVILAASPIIWSAIGTALRFIYLNLIVKVVILIIQLFALVASGIVSIISWIASLLNISVNVEESEVQVTKGVQDMEQALTGGAEIGGPWMTILAVAIVLVASVIFFRLMNQRRSPAYRASGVPETVEKVSLGHRRLPSGPNGTVRKAYRKMLLFMEDNGSRGDLTMSSTSEDVARVGKHYADREINDQLKDIYRKARYSPETVTSEEAKKAREIVKTIIR